MSGASLQIVGTLLGYKQTSTTEIVLQGFRAEMVMLDSHKDDDNSKSGGYGASDCSTAKNGGRDQEQEPQSGSQEFDSEIPF